jgi:hypothetical protein
MTIMTMLPKIADSRISGSLAPPIPVNSAAPRSAPTSPVSPAGNRPARSSADVPGEGNTPIASTRSARGANSPASLAEKNSAVVGPSATPDTVNVRWAPATTSRTRSPGATSPLVAVAVSSTTCPSLGASPACRR